MLEAFLIKEWEKRETDVMQIQDDTIKAIEGSESQSTLT